MLSTFAPGLEPRPTPRWDEKADVIRIGQAVLSDAEAEIQLEVLKEEINAAIGLHDYWPTEAVLQRINLSCALAAKRGWHSVGHWTSFRKVG